MTTTNRPSLCIVLVVHHYRLVLLFVCCDNLRANLVAIVGSVIVAAALVDFLHSNADRNAPNELVLN